MPKLCVQIVVGRIQGDCLSKSFSGLFPLLPSEVLVAKRGNQVYVALITRGGRFKLGECPLILLTSIKQS